MGEEKAKITVSLGKDGIKFKLEGTMKYVEVTRDEAEEYLCKAFYMSLNGIYKLVDISPYMYFLILKTPDWARTYISRLAICRLVGTTYEEFVQGKFPSGGLSDNVFLCLPNERGNFLVAKWIIEHTEVLTKDPKKQKEFVESILFCYGSMRKKSLEFQSYGADELIAMVILDRELPKKKIDDERGEDDEELFCTAFEHLKEKKVIEKFFKGKERQLPQSKEGLEELDG